ncbi:hypothetical protein P3G55_01455 [Leptospira sp. 96542]|nr:hypothetical protein [Leptospira sp. 96542]
MAIKLPLLGIYECGALMLKNSFGFVVIVLLVQCSISNVRLIKTDNFNPHTSVVATMPVYDTSTGASADPNDESLKTFGKIAQSEVGYIYGNFIPGGEATLVAAESLGVKEELTAAMGNIAEVALHEQTLNPKSKEVFALLADHFRVEALGFPIATGGKSKMVSEGVVYRFVVYDVKNYGIQYLAETPLIEIGSFSLGQADDDKKITALVVSKAVGASNYLFSKIKNELHK